jgi:hypothetical protein
VSERRDVQDRLAHLVQLAAEVEQDARRQCGPTDEGGKPGQQTEQLEDRRVCFILILSCRVICLTNAGIICYILIRTYALNNP